MPYIEAQEYADIYDQQDEIDIAERQAVRDSVLGVAPFLNLKAGDVNPSGEEAVRIKNQLEILQGQLLFVRRGWRRCAGGSDTTCSPVAARMTSLQVDKGFVGIELKTVGLLPVYST